MIVHAYGDSGPYIAGWYEGPSSGDAFGDRDNYDVPADLWRRYLRVKAEFDAIENAMLHCPRVDHAAD